MNKHKNRNPFFHFLLYNLIICFLFVSCRPEEIELPHITTTNVHRYHAVDLGLSVMWACCNVGADNPWERGEQYAWGQTDLNSDYDEDADIGSLISGTKYDVAHMKWKGNWRMPTKEEFQELLDNCSWEWIELNDVEGYLIVASNGNSIFLPSTDGESYRPSGCYWTGTKNTDDSWAGQFNWSACSIQFDELYSRGYFYNDFRDNTYAIRPIKDNRGIIKPENDYNDEIENEVSAQIIDLGLSVKWASCNVGATSPEEFGDYYAWGEIEEKDCCNWNTYKWCNGSYDTQTKYCTEIYNGNVDKKTTLEIEDDVARVKWGGKWRMPTKSEIKELYYDCTWVWAEINDKNGHLVIGPNGNSIFLPAAGYRDGDEIRYCGSLGYYWSSTLGEFYSSYNACALNFNHDSYKWRDDYRYYGYTVRPVKD